MNKVLAAAIAALLVASGVGLVTIEDDGKSSAAPTTTAVATSAPTTTTTAGPATTTTLPDVLAITIKQLQAFVEQRRGLRFTQPLKVSLLSAAAFKARLLEIAKDDDDELARTAAELRAVGLLKRGEDLKEGRDKLLAGAVVGLYEPKTDELLVRGTELTPYVRGTLVHEIVHAVQDQTFDLDRSEYDDREDEVAFGFSALAEGDAVRIQGEYIRSLSRSEQQQAASQEAEAGGSIDLRGVPRILVELLVFPYASGPALVKELLDAGGQGRLDQAFRDPPTTTETVIHPEKLIAGEKTKPVNYPPADSAVIDKGVVGEYVLQLMLAREMSPEAAARAAGGWGGDRYVAWSKDGKTCLRAAFVMDTAEDRDELATALTSWADEQDEASVSPSADVVTVTSCA